MEGRPPFNFLARDTLFGLQFVTKLDDPAQYMTVAVVYIEYVIKYFSVSSPPAPSHLSDVTGMSPPDCIGCPTKSENKSCQDKEVNVLIRDLVRHLIPNRGYMAQQEPLLVSVSTQIFFLFFWECDCVTQRKSKF